MKLLPLLALVAFAPAAHAADLPWVKGYDAAAKAAAKSNSLIMVDFYTDWCHWCKVLDEKTYPDEKVISMAKALVPVKIDAEKEGVALAKKYGVNAYPTILFLDSKGEVWGRVEGYLDPTGFIATVQPIIDAHKEWPATVEALKAKPNDPTLNAKYAFGLAVRGNAKDAAAAFAKVGSLKGKMVSRAASAIGDSFQTKQDWAQAITWFKKADEAADADTERAYARVSMMVCFLSQDKKDEAKEAAKALLALKECPAEYADLAKQVLNGGK